MAVTLLSRAAVQGMMPDTAPVKLFTLPYSHYGLKAEYLLGAKAIGYERCIVPRSEIPRLKDALGFPEIPVLEVHGERHGWRELPSVLDELAPEPALMPSSRPVRRLAKALEDWADLDLGHRARRLAFAYLKDNPSEVPKAFGGGLRGALVGGAATVVSSLAYGVTGLVQDQDERAMAVGLEHLEGLLADHGNLVGEELTRADIAVIALLDPVLSLEGLRSSFEERYVMHWALEHRGRLREQARGVRQGTQTVELAGGLWPF